MSTNPAKVAVRDARPGDCPAIAGLMHELLGHAPQAGTVRRRLARLPRTDTSRVLVAVVDGQVVGVVGLHVIPPLHRGRRLCRVRGLCVNAAYTRQGIGRQLVNAAEAFARRAGCHSIELVTAAGRTGAHAFYRRLGFTEAAKRFAKPVELLRRGRTR